MLKKSIQLNLSFYYCKLLLIMNKLKEDALPCFNYKINQHCGIRPLNRDKSAERNSIKMSAIGQIIVFVLIMSSFHSLHAVS